MKKVIKKMLAVTTAMMMMLASVISVSAAKVHREQLVFTQEVMM